MQVWLQGSQRNIPQRHMHSDGCTLGPATADRELLCRARGHLHDKATTLLVHLSQALFGWAKESCHSQSLWSKYASWRPKIKCHNSSFLLTRSKKRLSRYFKGLLDKSLGCSKSETALEARVPLHLGVDLQDHRDCRGYNYWGQESHELGGPKGR